MVTVEILIGGTFAITAALTIVKWEWGAALGCLSPIAAFASTVVAIILWPSGSSTDALGIIWVPIWVGCGALAGVVVGAVTGAGLRALRKR